MTWLRSGGRILWVTGVALVAYGLLMIELHYLVMGIGIGLAGTIDVAMGSWLLSAARKWDRATKEQA